MYQQCKQFGDSRRKLASLVYEMKSFTVHNLTRAFRKINSGNTMIDGVESVKSFVENLHQFGALSRHACTYTVVTK
jgi:hypothetical protein